MKPNITSRRSVGLFLLCAALAICTLSGHHQAMAQELAQPTFPSAPDACQALLKAVQDGDAQATAKVLGSPLDQTSTTDEALDRAERELFVHKYQEMHRLHREDKGSMTLYIGAENWPFPIPLVEKNGVWRFDPDAGSREILYRRIGENEITAIAYCQDFGARGSSDVNTEAGNDPLLLNGYYFRKLPSRAKGGKPAGGIALIAYPAEYRSTGVMTFIVTDKHAVYESDLGPKTAEIATAAATTTIRRDASWHAVGK